MVSVWEIEETADVFHLLGKKFISRDGGEEVGVEVGGESGEQFAVVGSR